MTVLPFCPDEVRLLIRSLFRLLSSDTAGIQHFFVLYTVGADLI
jgi:hypothetical protein